MKRQDPWVLFFVCLGLLFPVQAARAASEPTRLISVRPVVHPREMEVIIQVEGPFQHSFYELPGPPRLVVDLTPVQEVTAEASIRVGAFGVENIRAFLSQPGTARVVFELIGPAPFYLINTQADGLQVVFLSGTAGKRTAAPEMRPVAPRRISTIVGLSLANMSLAEERFQRVFGHRTQPGAAVDITQILLTRGYWALAAAAEVRRLSLEGQSTITAQATQAVITPLDLGLRLILQRGSLWPYLTAGPVLCLYEERSPLRDTSGTAMGFSFQAGILWGPSSFKLLKARAFIRWSRAVARENGLEMNLGGVEVGAGLALGFSFF